MPLCQKIDETVDKDLDDHQVYLECVEKSLKHFDKHITETITSHQQLIIAYEKVGQSYSEVSQGSERAIQLFAKDFSAEMRKLQEGNILSVYQGDIQRLVRDRLNPIVTERDKVYKMLKSVRDVKFSYDTGRHNIATAEEKYAKKNKPLSESKSYKKLSKKRDDSKAKYDLKKHEFEDAVRTLKKHVDSFIADTLGGFAASSGSIARYLGQELEKYANTAMEKQKLFAHEESEGCYPQENVGGANDALPQNPLNDDS